MNQNRSSSPKSAKKDIIGDCTDFNRSGQMKESRPKPYEYFLHPYVFVLKEGTEIHKDFLDYSLLLLQMGQGDILRSPPDVCISIA